MESNSLLLPEIIEALQGGQWALLVSSLVVFCVWAARTFLPQLVSSKQAPWLAALLGVLSGVAGQLASDSPSSLTEWAASVEQGIRTAGGAALLWSLVGKHLLAPRK